MPYPSPAIFHNLTREKELSKKERRVMKRKQTGVKTAKIRQSANSLRKQGCGCGKKTSK